jgi:hypothetical protein
MAAKKPVAQKPKYDLAVDWNEVPLLSQMPGGSRAFERCSMLNPELKVLRPQALKLVTDGIDALLLPAGYTRDGLVWRKGPGNNAEAKPGQEEERSWFRRVFSGGRPSLGEVTGKAIVLMGLNDGSVSLELQKDKYHHGFFINIRVRSVGRHDPDGHSAAGDSRSFRSQSFIRDVPRNYVVDEYYYVRLVEDPRYLAFLLNLIEDRILPFMQAFANTRTLVWSLPLAREMEQGRPLRLPEKERWRMFEFQPTQTMYERYARMGVSHGFALRDGRNFNGKIKEVRDGKVLLSWARDTLREKLFNTTIPVPPDEWVPFSLIDPGSLSYENTERQFIQVDFTVDENN